VPVAPARAVSAVVEADEVVCVATPSPFRAVGLHYRDFTPTSDRQVEDLLAQAAARDR
jgi:putative phosphoribosyl transferase